ncbi:MAG: alpha-amylase family glycosyl hydrolase [Bulleidia sp.]|nr:alpha-amylase family glycosyl hydrolase [Bulleidia sp.]
MAYRRIPLKPESIYQVFVRNYSEEGTFNALKNDLNRIQAMGFDWLYLLPFHPAGVEGRKGKDGSPYSIRDYRAVDSACGTMRDFQDLVDAAHVRGMKVMMDIVIHHTARDCVWVKEHPEYYHWKDGAIVNAVPDWSDVADLNFESASLRQELIRMLSFWARKGVDGFRCDVASLVPLDFWLDARKALQKINPQIVMLAESVEPEFVTWMRAEGHNALSDGEIAQAFDYLYPYSIRREFYGALEEGKLADYEQAMNHLLASLPMDTREIMFLENHDRQRFSSVVKNRTARRNWLAYSFLMLGTGFVYAGQEAHETHQPSLFDKDPVSWKHRDAEEEAYIAGLNALRRETQASLRAASLPENDKVLEVKESGENDYYGCFNVLNHRGSVPVHLRDGSYENLLNHKTVTVKDGKMDAAQCPFFARIRQEDLVHEDR